MVIYGYYGYYGYYGWLYISSHSSIAKSSAMHNDQGKQGPQACGEPLRLWLLACTWKNSAKESWVWLKTY